jgi:hypothetical protein
MVNSMNNDNTVTVPYDLLRMVYEHLAITGHYGDTAYKSTERTLSRHLSNYVRERDLANVHNENSEHYVPQDLDTE